jgi:hypothetical protein
MICAVTSHLTKSSNARILHVLRCARKARKARKVRKFCAIMTVSHLAAKCVTKKNCGNCVT